MKINLRFGMHRDIEVIHQEKDKIDGLVIPAHILAHQTASTAVFVTSLPRHKYIIDPMTYMIQQRKEAWLSEASGQVRISLRKMCDAYHPNILAALNNIKDSAFLNPADLPSVSDLCKCVMKYQLDVVAKESKTSKAAKYLSRYGNTAATTPRAVVPPYFSFASGTDVWYQYSLDCALATQSLTEKNAIIPVIAFLIEQLNANTFSRICKDYAEFPGVLLWAGDCNQTSVRPENIIQMRTLVHALSDGGATVESLYGGYLLMLMKDDGMNGISHGVLYTEGKGFSAVPGGGGVPDRYYIRAFHEFRSLSQTDLILHKHPELICNCQVCTKILRGSPDNLILFADNPDLLRRHFMTVRRLEADRLDKIPIKEELDEIERTYEKYHGSIGGLPNPDSIMDKAQMKGLDYLRVWVEGLRAKI